MGARLRVKVRSRRQVSWRLSRRWRVRMRISFISVMLEGILLWWWTIYGLEVGILSVGIDSQNCIERIICIGVRTCYCMWSWKWSNMNAIWGIILALKPGVLVFERIWMNVSWLKARSLPWALNLAHISIQILSHDLTSQSSYNINFSGSQNMLHLLSLHMALSIPFFFTFWK